MYELYFRLSPLPHTPVHHNHTTMMGKLHTKTKANSVKFAMKGDCKDDDEQKAQGILNYKDF